MPELLARLKSLLLDASNARRSGEAAESERLYKEAAAEAKAEDDATRAEALMGVAEARHEAGDRIGAAINYAEAITLLRSAAHTELLANSLRRAADVRSELREYAVAGSHIDEAIRLYRALDMQSNAAMQVELAHALRTRAMNSEREAHAAWREAQKIYQLENLTEAVHECSEHLRCLEHHDEVSKA